MKIYNSADGKVCTISEKYKDNKKNIEYMKKWLNSPRYIRVVFAQGKDALGMMRYRFKGVFKLNKEKTEMKQSAIWERISDEVETIKPAKARSTENRKNLYILTDII